METRRFGDVLTTIIVKHGISQADLCRKTGFNQTKISRWINNDPLAKLPDIVDVIKIVNDLNLASDERNELLVSSGNWEVWKAAREEVKKDEDSRPKIKKLDEFEYLVLAQHKTLGRHPEVSEKNITITHSSKDGETFEKTYTLTYKRKYGFVITLILIAILLLNAHRVIRTLNRLFPDIIPKPSEIEILPMPTSIATFTPEPFPTETNIPTVLPTITETLTVTPTAVLLPTMTPPAAAAGITVTAQAGIIEATNDGTLTAMPAGDFQSGTGPVIVTVTRNFTPWPTKIPTRNLTPWPTVTPTGTRPTATSIPPTATPVPVSTTISPTATATPPPVQLTTPPKVQLIDPFEGRVYKYRTSNTKSILFDWTSVTEPAGVKRYYEIIIQNINDDPAHPTFPQGVNNLTASQYEPQISKAFAQSRGLHRWHVRVRFLANGQEVVGEWSDWRNFRVDE